MKTDIHETRTAMTTAAESAPDAGLSGDEAARRLMADGPNELPTAKPRNLVQQAGDVLREPMLLLLVGAGAVYFVLARAAIA